jgi:hypothetical protein
VTTTRLKGIRINESDVSQFSDGYIGSEVLTVVIIFWDISQLMFQRNTSSPISGLNSKPSKKPA